MLPILVELRVQVGNIIITSLAEANKLFVYINRAIIVLGLHVLETHIKIVLMLINFVIGQMQLRVKQVGLRLKVITVIEMVDHRCQHRVWYTPSKRPRVNKVLRPIEMPLDLLL